MASLCTYNKCNACFENRIDGATVKIFSVVY